MSIYGVTVEDCGGHWMARMTTTDIGVATALFMKGEWTRDDIPVVMVEFARQERLIREERIRAEKIK